MIISLRGSIIQLKPFFLHLEVNGVGYEIKISLNTYEELQEKWEQQIKSKKEEKVFLFTRTIYSADFRFLYGFILEEEAQLFDFLKNLQGIGHNTAINLISSIGMNELFVALEKESISTIIKTPRIGRTKAEKIIFEAKQKSKKLQQLKQNILNSGNKSFNEDTSNYFSEEENLSLIEEALTSLGYTKKEIDTAYKRLEKSGKDFSDIDKNNLQDYIRLFLSVM